LPEFNPTSAEALVTVLSSVMFVSVFHVVGCAFGLPDLHHV